jgi:hypothetical protein
MSAENVLLSSFTIKETNKPPRVTPDVVLEWLTLVVRVREVLGSSFGPEAGYANWGFCSFP